MVPLQRANALVRLRAPWRARRRHRTGRTRLANMRQHYHQYRFFGGELESVLESKGKNDQSSRLLRDIRRLPHNIFMCCRKKSRESPLNTKKNGERLPTIRSIAGTRYTREGDTEFPDRLVKKNWRESPLIAATKKRRELPLPTRYRRYAER